MTVENDRKDINRLSTIQKRLKFVFRNFVDFQNLDKDQKKKIFQHFFPSVSSKTFLFKYF
jgi:hypothetical protein